MPRFDAVVLAVALAAFVPIGALAHSWYPANCCSGQDCEEVDASSIEPRAGGYLIKATGEIWPYDKVKDPPDGRIHRCWYRAGPLTGKTICLFAPPPGA